LYKKLLVKRKTQELYGEKIKFSNVQQKSNNTTIDINKPK